jgi:serine/threonine-protein kinase HipA
VNTARVNLWGRYVGAVTWLADRGYGAFQYSPEFLTSGLELSPLHMPLAHGSAPFQFPGLGREGYQGLPGLLADVLPDKFGNAVIDAWLAREGRDRASFHPVERLCTMGRRGMGALEFEPAIGRGAHKSVAVDVAALASLAQQITQERRGLSTQVGQSPREDADAILDIIRVGSSAGGARPKAVIAMDDAGHIRSGQVTAPPGFDYWLLKFDGVDDLELGSPGGYGRIEYAYSLMARAAGIEMSESKLLEEGERAHFVTRRFDRRSDGSKLHLQSLCGLAHLDFNQPGAHSYEQAFAVMRELGLSRLQSQEQFRRTVFNVVARNQDDHTKNIAYLMDDQGQWSLSPAYDMTFAYNPRGAWTSAHQMTVGGKRRGFTVADLLELGAAISLPRPQRVIDEVIAAVQSWPSFAEQAGVAEERCAAIGQCHRFTS